MAILYSIKHTLNPDMIKKKKKELVLIQKKRKRSSLNIQAQIVNQTYLHQQIKTKTEGEVVEKQQFLHNPSAPTPWISIMPNVLSQRWYVCIITSGARHTESSSHPGASFLKDLQGQRHKNKDGVNVPPVQGNLQETGACWVSHCQALTGSSHWDSLFQPGALVHLPNVPPESKALNRAWRKGRNVCTKQGREKPCAGGSRGPMLAEPLVRRRQPSRWGDTMLGPHA